MRFLNNGFWDLFKFKQIGFLSPGIQILIICVFFCITLLIQRKEYRSTGKTYGRYPWKISTFLSSIYEEIIFRGFILFGLLMFLSLGWSIFVSSAVFGLWHIKNYKWQTKKQTTYQILYTGCIFAPVISITTLWFGTIWIAVIIHYLHNLFAEVLRKSF